MSTDTTPHRLVGRITAALCLDPDVRYDLGLVRNSLRGDLEKLEDQEDTGIGVFKDKVDFQALAELHGSAKDRGWMEVRYGDVLGSL
ncbi:MAG TPA: hypothetical protein ENH00_04660 [Actinobacteria bacterium]|nr:hypothetical protein [Actinomycetota bacterium]